MDIRESLDMYFKLVEDPRSKAHITYEMSDILFMLVIGMLYSCTRFRLIIEFAEEKIDFLRKYTEMKEAPCLANILKIINPKHLELCLYGIFSNVLQLKMKTEERQICIDGKTICSTANAYNNSTYYPTLFRKEKKNL